MNATKYRIILFFPFFFILLAHNSLATCPDPQSYEGMCSMVLPAPYCKLDTNEICGYSTPCSIPVEIRDNPDLYVQLSYEQCTAGDSSGASIICNLDCCDDSIIGTDDKCYSSDANKDLDENVCTQNLDGTSTNFKWQTIAGETNQCCGDDAVYLTDSTDLDFSATQEDYGYISSDGKHLCTYDGTDWVWEAASANPFQIITIDPTMDVEEEIETNNLFNKIQTFIKNIFTK